MALTESYTEDNTYTLTARLSAMYEVAKERKKKLRPFWIRNYNLANNRMWTEARTNSYMPSPSDSEIYPILSTIIAWMTDQEVRFSCSAAADPHSPTSNYYGMLATVLQTLMSSNWQTENWDAQAALVIWDSLLYGAGVLKCVWDPTLAEGLGNAALIRVDPWRFYPDPHALNEDDAEYFVEVHHMSIGELERRFPLAKEQIWANLDRLITTSQDDSEIPPDLWFGNYQRPVANAVMLPSPPNTPGAFGRPGQGAPLSAMIDTGICVKEYWVKENRYQEVEETNPSLLQPDEVAIPEWRVIVVAGEIVLQDTWASDLWGCARHPYVRESYDDAGMDFWGMPLTSHLAHLQIALNRLLSAMQGNGELCGNPIFLDIAGSGIDRTLITNRPGQRLTQNQQSAAGNKQPGWMSPPQMPSYIQAMIDWYITRLENIAGIGGPTKGAMPAPRTPSASVTATQEAGFVRVRQAMRNRQAAISKAGELLANLVIENYTTPRVVSVVGTDGVQASLALAARHFYGPTGAGGEPLRFSILVDAGANNPTSRSARISEADVLFGMGAIDQQALLEAHNYPGAQEIIARMKANAPLTPPKGPASRVRAQRNS